MKRYYKEENGDTVWFNGVLKIDGLQIINPSEEQLINAGYIRYVPKEPTQKELLIEAKRAKIAELMEYDSSAEVNDCVIVYQGLEINYWASKDERNGLKTAVRDCIAIGREMYRLDLRDIGVSIDLRCDVLLQMLAVLEVYAIDCYNKTTDHEFAIKSMTSVDEIDAYAFKVGYPEIPRFEL